jgi:copper chaperone CopZ
VSKKNAVNKKQVTTYGIGGIMCAHCKATVEKGLSEIYGVKSVHVDISTGLTSVEGAHYAEDVKRTVEQLGYDFNGIIIEADSSKK